MRDRGGSSHEILLDLVGFSSRAGGLQSMSDFKEVTDGKAWLRNVELQAAKMAEVEDGLERGYAHLGMMLWEVSEMQYWRVYHETFRKYLESVAVKAKRTPGQMQQYFLTVRDLSDTFNSSQLESIGITKAMRLRQAKDYAIVLPAEVVKAALDPAVTSKELKKVISTALKMPEEEGDWMDLDFAFYVTPEERATIEDAMCAAEHCDPVTKKTIAESMQKKDVVLKWCMEFLGSHSREGV